MNSEIQSYRESSPSMQIVARRVDLRQSFTQARAVPSDGAQRLASRLLIASSLAGLVLTLVGHL